MNVYIVVFREPWHARTTYQLKVSYPASSTPTCNSISDVEPNDSMTWPQAIFAACNPMSGTFLNDAAAQVAATTEIYPRSLHDALPISLLNGLTVDYDLEIYDAAGNWVG